MAGLLFNAADLQEQPGEIYCRKTDESTFGSLLSHRDVPLSEHCLNTTVGNDGPKISLTASQQQPELLICSRMDPCFHGLCTTF